MGSDVEERGAGARGGLEVDAEVPSLPAGRHVDRRLHLKGKRRLLFRLSRILDIHCGASTQSQCSVLFSFGSSGYQLCCTVAAMSAQQPVVKHVINA